MNRRIDGLLRRVVALGLALGFGLGSSMGAGTRAAGADEAVEQWGLYEVTLKGPSTGNPFTEVELSARFSLGDRSETVAGFYDGDGVYRVRFMPDEEGGWSYETRSNRPELDRKAGEFAVGKPSSGNHGPVRVRPPFHFSYADGTPYYPIGTTCYAWTHQGDALEEQTLATLKQAPFNKMRMCVFPKHYAYNNNEPLYYPFAGTPPRDWDFSRFNPEFFRHLEQRVGQLRDLGIEADLILFHPYDKGHWGFDRMAADADDRYLRYLLARLSAYRNVWWSLANEWDFMKEKERSDWDRFFRIVQDGDPSHHLRSIHNGTTLYNQTQPWVTHASIQNGSAVADFGRAGLYRDVYLKPIVFDEVKYEGNIPLRWGNIGAEEMVHRFWQGTVAGTYVGHGETYLDPKDILWWSKGGVLHGESPRRIAFLRKILEDGPPGGFEPIDKWQEPQIAGKKGDYYFIYFGQGRPTGWTADLPRAGLNVLPLTLQADVIDTWDMTITPVSGPLEFKPTSNYVLSCESPRTIALPGKPYMAIRLRRVSP